MEFRTKMSREERAKQFMPFAALKGYPEALRAKERILIPRITLSDDYAEEVNRRLLTVRKGDVVTVVYFSKGEYVKLTGMVALVSCDLRILKIVNEKIPFQDIYDIQTENNIRQNTQYL